MNNKKGSALAMVLIVMVILTVLGAATIRIALAETTFASRHETKLQAYYIARSGAQGTAEYMLKDANNNAHDLIGQVSDWNSQVGGGQFQVTVTDDVANKVVIIESVGELNGIDQTVRIRLVRSTDGLGGIFQHAIVAKEGISVSSNGNKTEIVGSIATKEGEIVLDKATSTGDQLIDPTLIFPPIVLPPDRIPSIDYSPTSFGNLNIVKSSVSPEIASSAGTPVYTHADSINIKDNSFNVTGDGVVHLYVEGDIILDTKASFDVGADAKLYIYVKGEHLVKLSGAGAQNNIFLYAPDSTIEWQNAQPSNDFFGAIIGKTVSLQNQLLIRHNPDMVNDVDLDTSGVGATFTGYSWID